LVGSVTADDFRLAILAQHDWCSFHVRPRRLRTGCPAPDRRCLYL
jgi:hypothetical protein